MSTRTVKEALIFAIIGIIVHIIYVKSSIEVTIDFYICRTNAAPCLVKVQTCTRHGEPFFVLAPEFYNSFWLMRAVPAGANRKMRQNTSFFAVIVSGDQTKTMTPSQASRLIYNDTR
jgi:hypothetical protein